MTVNLSSDIVGSRFDAVRQVNIYTVRRGGRIWTVEVPLSEVHKHAGNKIARCGIVARYCQSVLNGPSDDERSDKKLLPPA